jgi:hypothetical protein
VDKTYTDLLQVLTDEAKEGPRLFSFFPVDRNAFNPNTWIREKFRLVLWCEHSRLPPPVLNNGDMKKGVYDLELEREWFTKTAPYLKFVASTLSMVLPVASSTFKVINDSAFKSLQDQIGFGKDVIDAMAGEATARDSFNKADSADIQTELKETLKQLAAAVETMSKTLSAEQATEAAEDFGKLVEEATKPKPNKKWYSVSIEGLIKAAENLDKLGEPVISLSRKALSLLTGGVVKWQHSYFTEKRKHDRTHLHRTRFKTFDVGQTEWSRMA